MKYVILTNLCQYTPASYELKWISEQISNDIINNNEVDSCLCDINITLYDSYLECVHYKTL